MRRQRLGSLPLGMQSAQKEASSNPGMAPPLRSAVGPWPRLGFKHFPHVTRKFESFVRHTTQRFSFKILVTDM